MTLAAQKCMLHKHTVGVAGKAQRSARITPHEINKMTLRIGSQGGKHLTKQDIILLTGFAMLSCMSHIAKMTMKEKSK